MSSTRNQAGNPPDHSRRRVQTAVAAIRRRTKLDTEFAIVLGSGFHGLLDQVEILDQIPFAEVPGLVVPRVPGHQGELIFGLLESVPVLVLSGRSHYYEGWSMADVTFPVRIVAGLGTQALLLTNAAGGINRRYRPGDFMQLTDHLNFTGTNPLRGEPAAEPRSFVDLSQVYDRAMNQALKKAARLSGVRLHAGVYLAVSGPSYETPAEIRAFGKWGADAVGMSTVPEAIVARQCGLRVAGLSCITNLAAGLGGGVVSHAEVLATGQRVREQAASLLRHFVRAFCPTT